MDKFNMPDRTPQFKKLENSMYLVRSFAGIFEAATDFTGHGVSKIKYACPEDAQTNNVNGMYPRIMAFRRDLDNKYCPNVTFCINEEQNYQIQKYFEDEYS